MKRKLDLFVGCVGIGVSLGMAWEGYGVGAAVWGFVAGSYICKFAYTTILDTQEELIRLLKEHNEALYQRVMDPVFARAVEADTTENVNTPKGPILTTFRVIEGGKTD